MIDADKLAPASVLRDKGFFMKEIAAKTGLKRTTLYRHLPPRSPAMKLEALVVQDQVDPTYAHSMPRIVSQPI